MIESKFIDLLKNRRSYYNLGKDVSLNKDDIIKLIKYVLYYSPSAFNSQSSRAVILFDKDHDELWGNIVMNKLKELLNNEQKFKTTEEKINNFKKAYGTILLFEDMNVINNLKETFTFYSDNFEPWSEQASGIVTIGCWIVLEEQGLGANLQHYNPIIDDEIKERWNIPASWKLRSQLVFGNILSPPKDREYIDIDKRVFIK